MPEIEYQEFVRRCPYDAMAIIPCFANSKQRINQSAFSANPKMISNLTY